MEHGGWLYQAFVYLAASVCSVPIAKRLGLGSVLGYLLAGVLIGPFIFGLVGDTADVMHFAEFGVVMMLFLVGLELRPLIVWQMRVPIMGLGGFQLALTTGLIAALCISFGLPWQHGLAIGLILAMSSTAIVLQSLNERGLMKSEAGQSAFAVLLFQDIAVIPILALLPLLAIGATGAAPQPGAAGEALHGIASLPHWQQALVIVGSIGAILTAGRFLMRPALRFVAASKLPEIFTASTLLLVVGVALVMEQIGLSPALGTFLAGVVLADSEYRHELESNIEPFKGLLLGLFFISVGSSIDFALLLQTPGLILALVLALVAIKFAVLYGLGMGFRLARPDQLLFAFSLAQGGEFAFVLLAFVVRNGVLSTELAGTVLLVVALSMVAAPLLLLVHDRLDRLLFDSAGPEQEPDVIDHGGEPVILAGFGRFGQIAGRLLLANGIKVTVLDHDAEQVKTLRRFGFKVFYGDASKMDLLHAAGAAEAKLLVLAINDRAKSLEIVEQVQKHFPQLRILARAADLVHVFELRGLGVESVHRETFSSAIDLGVEALRHLGMRAHQATRAGRAFRRHDEEAIKELAEIRHDRKAFISRRTQQREQLKQDLNRTLHETNKELEEAWDSAHSASED